MHFRFPIKKKASYKFPYHRSFQSRKSWFTGFTGVSSISLFPGWSGRSNFAVFSSWSPETLRSFVAIWSCWSGGTGFACFPGDTLSIAKLYKRLCLTIHRLRAVPYFFFFLFFPFFFFLNLLGYIILT